MDAERCALDAATAAKATTGNTLGGPPILRESSPDMAALEAAAWHSLRDLRAICSSSSSPTAAAAAGTVPGRPSPSSPGLPSSSASAVQNKGGRRAGSAHKLRGRVRAEGLLASLVSVCTPFPWTPVGPPLDSASAAALPDRCTANGAVNRIVAAPLAAVDAAVDTTAAEEAGASPGSTRAGPAAARNHPDDAADVAGSKAVAPAVVSAGERGGLQPGAQKVGDRRSEHDHPAPCQATASPPRAHGGEEKEQENEEENEEEKGAAENGRKASRDTREAAPDGGCGGGGGREAMVECALDVLLAVLEEEPGNREHVLRIDGGAPLVRGTSVR